MLTNDYVVLDGVLGLSCPSTPYLAVTLYLCSSRSNALGNGKVKGSLPPSPHSSLIAPPVTLCERFNCGIEDTCAVAVAIKKARSRKTLLTVKLMASI